MCEADLCGYKLSADEALALDYLLGILIGPDLGRALVRVRKDMEFSLLVSQYLERFSTGLADGGPIDDTMKAPRSEIWDAIHAQISTIRDS